MSQAKVDKYKEQKAKRKETMKKEKRAALIRSCVAGVVLVAVIGWVGYSGVTYYLNNRPRPSVDVNYTSIADYTDGFAAQTTTVTE